jgi:hypothetical protein
MVTHAGQEPMAFCPACILGVLCEKCRICRPAWDVWGNGGAVCSISSEGAGKIVAHAKLMSLLELGLLLRLLIRTRAFLMVASV